VNKAFPVGEYDYIFDIEDPNKGGMFKLPFNDGQSHYKAALAFCKLYQINMEDFG
jgi:hypothetical protein